MNISLSNNTNSIFKHGKPAFLQHNMAVAANSLKPNGQVQQLTQLMQGKLDKSTVSGEAKQLLAQLKQADPTEEQANTKNEVQAFIGLAQQSLHDLANDLDSQLKNVAILKNEAATAEEKANARANIGYIEQVANVRGGIFNEQLLNKVVPNGSNIVAAAYDKAKDSSAQVQELAAKDEPLWSTNAKSLGLEGIANKSPAEMRELLTAAKNQVAQKIAAFDAVSTEIANVHPTTKTELNSESPKKAEAQTFEQLLAAQLKDSPLYAALLQLTQQKEQQ